MYALGDMAREVGRSAAYIKGLQQRFALPVLEGVAYSEAYLALVRKLVFLRTLGISEEAILKVWTLEKKLLTLLNADASGSPTWFLDQCGRRGRPRQRLLLSHFDLGCDLFARKLQVLLPMRGQKRELFPGHEMGEDAMRLLDDYLAAYERIRRDAAAQVKPLRAAATWAGRLPQKIGAS
jgi:hypothetical protein